METTIDEIRVELNKISNFITTWINENPYKNDVDAHNAKYRKDFKAFFDGENFVHEEYEFWSKTS